MSIERRLPEHITEADVREITRIVSPVVFREAWNAAIDAAGAALDAANQIDEVPGPAFSFVSALRKP